MLKQVRAAGTAALVIFLAFAVHASNVFYFEPRMGFAGIDDYARIPLIARGLESLPWLWSGYAHIATGFALVVLAVVGHRLFEPARPLAARLVLATGVLAALPFALTGVCDVQGRMLRALFDANNPGLSGPLYAAFALLRGIASQLAIILAGWFVLQFNWSLRQTRRVGFLLGLLGYATGFAALSACVWPAGYGLAYLLLPAWTLWIGIDFLADTGHVVQPEDI